MRTLDAGRVTSGLRRDLELLRRIASMIAQYWLAGGRLRRAYRRCESKGEILWLDAQGPTQHREASLHGKP